MLYTQRPVILNGIEDYVRKSDLVDRTVFLELPSITQNRRRAEAAFWKAFHAEHSLILGGVLDAIVAGLRELPPVELSRLPRMADFALWGEAVSRGLGWEEGSFMSAYEDSRLDATESSLGGTPLGSILLKIASTAFEWECSPTELYEMLTTKVGRRVSGSAAWPKTVQKFTSELRRLSPQLRVHGLSISFRRTNEGRLVSLVTAEFMATVDGFGGLGGGGGGV